MPFQIRWALSCSKVTVSFCNRGTWSGDNIFWEMFCPRASFKTGCCKLQVWSQCHWRKHKAWTVCHLHWLHNAHLNIFWHWWVEVEVATAFYTFCAVPGWDFYYKSSFPLVCVYFFVERSGWKTDENNFSEYFYILTMFFLPPGKRHQGGKPSLQRVELDVEKEELSCTAVENESTYIDTFGSDHFKYLKWKGGKKKTKKKSSNSILSATTDESVASIET